MDPFHLPGFEEMATREPGIQRRVVKLVKAGICLNPDCRSAAKEKAELEADPAYKALRICGLCEACSRRTRNFIHSLPRAKRQAYRDALVQRGLILERDEVRGIKTPDALKEVG
jgi:hypothetical protein